jgi:hypothetical protein
VIGRILLRWPDVDLDEHAAVGLHIVVARQRLGVRAIEVAVVRRTVDRVHERVCRIQVEAPRTGRRRTAAVVLEVDTQQGHAEGVDGIGRRIPDGGTGAAERFVCAPRCGPWCDPTRPARRRQARADLVRLGVHLGFERVRLVVALEPRLKHRTLGGGHRRGLRRQAGSLLAAQRLDRRDGTHFQRTRFGRTGTGCRCGRKHDEDCEECCEVAQVHVRVRSDNPA